MRRNTGRENSRKRKMGWKENHPVIMNKKKRGSEITEPRFFLFVYGLAAKVTLPLQETLPLLQRPALLGAKVTQGSHQVRVGVAVDHDIVDVISGNVELGE